MRTILVPGYTARRGWVMPCNKPRAFCLVQTKTAADPLLNVGLMSPNARVESPDPFAQVTPPSRVTVRCCACGYERTTLVLHADALRRAGRCERCGATTDLVEAGKMHGIGCSCCA